MNRTARRYALQQLHSITASVILSLVVLALTCAAMYMTLPASPEQMHWAHLPIVLTVMLTVQFTTLHFGIDPLVNTYFNWRYPPPSPALESRQYSQKQATA